KISYKKYRNFKTKRENEHFEYLFFIEKKDINEVTYESPLNYIGSKSKMIAEMKPLMPSEIDKFVDLFGGGFNVGINIKSQKTIYNDTNWIVKDLVKSFSKYETYDYLMYIQRMIKKFGLEASNRESYLNVRNHYNSLPIADRDPRLLYTVILYGFQQQIRFNSDYDFNNPVGMRWFNDRVLEKMVSFSRAIKEENFEFTSRSFEDYIDEIDSNTFVYMDPPYMLTNGSYNDGKRGFGGWTTEHEQKLMDFADELNRRGIKFMISYVLEHQGEVNDRM
ncbi:TPA: DNA adenine methylase, partial [Listeria monocytogenes]|nr:DNA adenine methylase [Listeria monocytogenes]